MDITDDPLDAHGYLSVETIPILEVTHGEDCDGEGKEQLLASRDGWPQGPFSEINSESLQPLWKQGHREQ